MDKCFYCDRVYHPMPVYQNNDTKELIHVCTNWAIKQGDPRYDQLEPEDIFHEVETSRGKFRFAKSDCTEKAKAAGYISRPDLTPKR